MSVQGKWCGEIRRWAECSLCMMLVFFQAAKGVAQISPKEQLEIDSLYEEVAEAKEDTTIINGYFNLSKVFFRYDLDSAQAILNKNKSLIINHLDLPPHAIEDRREIRNLLINYLTFSSKQKRFVKALGTYYNFLGHFLITQGDIKKGLDAHQICRDIRKIMGNEKTLAISINNIGQGHYLLGQLDTALSYFQKALAINERISNKKSLLHNLNNIGTMHFGMGNILKALDSYQRAIVLGKELGLESQVAKTLQNIGSMYHSIQDTTEASAYYLQALEVLEKLEDKRAMASVCNNLGRLFSQQKTISKALKYHQQSLSLNKEMKDEIGIARSMNHIGWCHFLNNDSEQALSFCNQALKIHQKKQYYKGELSVSSNLAEIYLEQGDINKAFAFANNAYSLSQNMSFAHLVEGSARILSKVYQQKGNNEKALELYKIHIEKRDSVQNKELAKKIVRMEMEHQYKEEKLLLQTAHEKSLAVKEEEQKRQHIYLFFVSSIALLLLVMAIVIYRNLSRKKSLVAAELEVSELKLKMEKKDFENQLNLKNKELLGLTLNITQNEQFLEKLNLIIKNDSSSHTKAGLEKTILELQNEIRIDKVQKKNQLEFQKVFESIHKNYLGSLKSQYPKLTATELRTCALIKINMSSYDICSVLGISKNTLSSLRYRIHKKIDLPKGEKLADFLLKYQWSEDQS